MSDRRYSSRDHDAEWILHQERSYNDGLLQKQRRTQSKKRNFDITSPRRLATTSPEQRNVAAERIRDAAKRRNAPAADLSEALDMLGLGDAKTVTTYTDKGERRRFVAACPDCERPTIQLRVDGRYISHPRQAKQPINDLTRCPGSGEPADVNARQVLPLKPRQGAQRPATTTRPATAEPLPLRSACQDEDPELFFPVTYGDAHADQVRKAKGVCGRCPLARACLRYALDYGELDEGIWGGLTPKERRRLTARPSERATA